MENLDKKQPYGKYIVKRLNATVNCNFCLEDCVNLSFAVRESTVEYETCVPL